MLPDGRRCWVEAIASSPGNDPNLLRYPVPMPSSLTYRLNDAAMVLRYTSAFGTKRAQIEGYKSNNVVRQEDGIRSVSRVAD